MCVQSMAEVVLDFYKFILSLVPRNETVYYFVRQIDQKDPQGLPNVSLGEGNNV